MKISWFKFGLILALGLFVWFIFFGKTPVDPLKSNRLIIGTNAEFAPFCFIKDNKIVGFDIDLALEVSRRMGKNPQLKNMDFDMLVPEIQIGGVHMLAAGMTATPERSKQVLFTDPYIKGVPLMVVSLKKRPLDKDGLDGLFGKRVVVNDGFTADLYLSEQKDIDLRRLPTVTDAFLALESGQVDAYVSAKNALTPFFKERGQENYNVSAIKGTDENCALAISKKYPELKKEVQLVLDGMEKDGTLDSLKKKWNLE